MAFLKNRTANLVVTGLIIFAGIGIFGSLLANPAGFLQRIAVIILIGGIVYFFFRHFYLSTPEKQEQRAFIKAAKRSKKRFKHKDGKQTNRRSNVGSLSSLKKQNRRKKKSPVHLTVIEGKKGKKKNRASF
ncbi:SA1362 family protein [Bacillus methanolicus]|uniref:SA1362 family protein n=1 Tax=Bacillus methanolicus TaxID=1471 RepID=UPI001ED916AA|nr:SA1362 family protein [Bacillus methanolicus]